LRYKLLVPSIRKAPNRDGERRRRNPEGGDGGEENEERETVGRI